MLQSCSGCKGVHYCSRAHQAADWDKHKTVCRDPESNPLLRLVALASEWKLTVSKDADADPSLGRGLRALADFRAGDVLLRDPDSIVGRLLEDLIGVQHLIKSLPCFHLLQAAPRPWDSPEEVKTAVEAAKGLRLNSWHVVQLLYSRFVAPIAFAPLESPECATEVHQTVRAHLESPDL